MLRPFSIESSFLAPTTECLHCKRFYQHSVLTLPVSQLSTVNYLEPLLVLPTYCHCQEKSLGMTSTIVPFPYQMFFMALPARSRRPDGVCAAPGAEMGPTWSPFSPWRRSSQKTLLGQSLTKQIQGQGGRRPPRSRIRGGDRGKFF